MVRQLLAERFKLAFHRDSKELAKVRHNRKSTNRGRS